MDGRGCYEDASWALSTLSTSDDANEDFPRRPRDLHQTRSRSRYSARGRLLWAADGRRHCALRTGRSTGPLAAAVSRVRIVGRKRVLYLLSDLRLRGRRTCVGSARRQSANCPSPKGKGAPGYAAERAREGTGHRVARTRRGCTCTCSSVIPGGRRYRPS